MTVMLLILWIMTHPNCWSCGECSWGRLMARNDVCGHGRAPCRHRAVAVTRRMHLWADTKRVCEFPCCRLSRWLGQLPVPTGATPASSNPRCWPSQASGNTHRSWERRSLTLRLILKRSHMMGWSFGCHFIIPQQIAVSLQHQPRL